MLDTVALGFHEAPSSSQLSSWFYDYFRYPDGRVRQKYSTTIPMPSCGSLYAVYYPQDITYGENPLLKLEFSLAKAFFGNNVQMLEDVPEAAERINKELRLITRIPPLDLFNGVVFRLDPCYNHQVGDFVQDYIRAFFALNYPHRKTMPYFDQGVQYHAKSVSSKFYDKEIESGLPQAYGILRQEDTLHDRGRIAELLEVQEPTLNSITKDHLQKILTNDLHVLKINNQLLASRDMASEILVEKYGYLVGYRLMGYLVRRQTMTKQQIMDQDHLTCSRLNMIEKQITDAGVSLALIDTKQPLPPLRIDL